MKKISKGKLHSRFKGEVLLAAAGALVMLAATGSVFAGTKNDLPPFAVVELFSSEGCSSCPPADQLLRDIAQEARKGGSRIFTLSFQVDYWNSLGWKDPFSSLEYTARQYLYARALKSSQVFTPQMIINGRHSFTGSNVAKAHQNIKEALAVPARVLLQIHIARQSPSQITVEYSTDGRFKESVLNLALVERSLVSKVLRGENAGRTLVHDNIVRDFKTVRLKENKSGQLSLHPPSAAVLGHMSVVGFIQDPATMEILGATSAEL